MPHSIPIDVGLIQINNSFSGQHYLPYSVGLIQSYAQAHIGTGSRLRFRPALYRRLPVADIVSALAGADVVGVSTYVWNNQISHAAARAIKEAAPETLIVFGGPQVPNDTESFLSRHPYIDVAVRGEGEETFTELLEAFADDREFEKVAGLGFRTRRGDIVNTPNRPRIMDLDKIPSPFLSGIFESIMRSEESAAWIGLWETNRGCPFGCTFCDWGSALAAKVGKFGMERLKAELQWFSDHRIQFIFCCDANFGILPRDVEIAQMAADIKRTTGYPQALSVQNTKNATERAFETQLVLAKSGLSKGVALSMQSTNATTLERVKRKNISLETYFELQSRFTAAGIETYSDLILALPGETYDSFVDGVDHLIGTGQHNRIQFNNLSILPNAEMADPTYRRNHGLVTVETKIINIHGTLADGDDGVAELQELVVGTATMPKENWRRVRTFSWTAALLYFDKLLQVPMLLAHTITGLSFRRQIEAFMGAAADRFPVLNGIGTLFQETARAIQDGGPEYLHAKDWLNIWWPADEYAFLDLTAKAKINDFYAEAETLLLSLLPRNTSPEHLRWIKEAVHLNRMLLKQPFVADVVELELSADLLGAYEHAKVGRAIEINAIPSRVKIDRSIQKYDDFQRWAEEVVWFGNKKGAYLYTNTSVDPQVFGIY